MKNIFSCKECPYIRGESFGATCGVDNKLLFETFRRADDNIAVPSECPMRGEVYHWPEKDKEAYEMPLL